MSSQKKKTQPPWSGLQPRQQKQQQHTHLTTHLEIVQSVKKMIDFHKFKGYHLPEITNELKPSGSWFKDSVN